MKSSDINLSFFSFFHIVLIFLGPLYFHISFRIQLPISIKMPAGFLIGIALDLQMNLVRNEILTLNTIESADPWTYWLGQTSIIFQSYLNFHISGKLLVLQPELFPWSCGLSLYVETAQPSAENSLETPLQTVGLISALAPSSLTSCSSIFTSFNNTIPQSQPPQLSQTALLGIHLWVHQIGLSS